MAPNASRDTVTWTTWNSDEWSAGSRAAGADHEDSIRWQGSWQSWKGQQWPQRRQQRPAEGAPGREQEQQAHRADWGSGGVYVSPPRHTAATSSTSAPVAWPPAADGAADQDNARNEEKRQREELAGGGDRWPGESGHKAPRSHSKGGGKGSKGSKGSKGDRGPGEYSSGHNAKKVIKPQMQPSPYKKLGLLTPNVMRLPAALRYKTLKPREVRKQLGMFPIFGRRSSTWL